uniref:Cytochrome b5 n=1 Tax=Clastoptera arizonana TaxID=38151 RepID=A0A1B6D5K6_9HEMI
MMEQFSWDEIRLHNRRENCWVVIESFVYDVTNFLSKHPAGPELILEQAGKDGTKPFFNAGHPPYAKEYLKTFRIGEISEPDRKTVIRLPPITTSEILSSSSTTSNRSDWQTYILYAILGIITLIGIFIIVLFIKLYK